MKSDLEKLQEELKKAQAEMLTALEAATTPSALKSLEANFLKSDSTLARVKKDIERMSEASRPYAAKIEKEICDTLTQASKVGAGLEKAQAEMLAALEAATTPSALKSLEANFLKNDSTLARVKKDIERMSEAFRPYAAKIEEEVRAAAIQASKMHRVLEDIRAKTLAALEAANTPSALESLRIDYSGRRSELKKAMSQLGNLSEIYLPSAGQRANQVSTNLDEVLGEKKEALDRRAQEKRIKAEAVDITLPGRKPAYGKAHPVMQVLERIEAIFRQMGFEVVTGPDVETEYYNFDALNTPADHPARDLHDTFYLTDGHLLRTHTSPVQIRTMENREPPVRIIVPGKCYRVDYDVSHTPMFHQVEGLLVDTHATFSELKGILTSFARQMFGDQTQMRFRPHFFPFTEPSAEMDISCTVCQGKGCRSCSGTGWVEIMGAGAVDPAVFEAVNYDPDEVTGFAFGMGVERLANLQFRIPDIRTLYENDLRFLRQF